LQILDKVACLTVNVIKPNRNTIINKKRVKPFLQSMGSTANRNKNERSYLMIRAICYPIITLSNHFLIGYQNTWLA